MKINKIITALVLCLVSVFAFVGCSSSNEDGSLQGQLLKIDEIESGAYESLPIIDIETEDHQIPTDKENYVNCSFKLSNCDTESYNFEVSMKDSYGDDDSVGIRLRGNSTRRMDKKPYRIKFDSKTSLFGLEKNKSWVLLADYKDTSKIRNYTAFKLASTFENLDFSPTPHHVVLFLNGYYQGVYLLCEQMDENKGRAGVKEDILDTDTSFPFLVEMDRNALKEGITGVDNFQPDYFYPIEIKYPEAEDRIAGDTDVVFNYIQEYINAAFESLNTGKAVNVRFSSTLMSFNDLVDVDSFMEYYLVNEIMHNTDSTWGSVYMHKTKTGKLKFGPVWDFDWSLSATYTDDPYSESEIYAANRFAILTTGTPLTVFAKNQENFNLLCDKWIEVGDNILDVVEHLKEYKQTLQSAARFDAKYWYGNTGAYQFDMQYDYVRLFLLDRYEFLNSQLVESNYSNLFNN